MLVIICVLILGALITFQVPMTWIGQLPGDFSLEWNNMRIYLPVTTALVFSAAFSVLLFIFSRK